jgi:hypothetical protein
MPGSPIKEWLFPPECRRPPDARMVSKGHGRREIRELWLVPAGDLEPYLAQEWGWVGVQQVGWLRRQQQRRGDQPWCDETVTLVVSQAPSQADPATVLRQVRGHWGIENQLHWVRDVVGGEDHNRSRITGRVLATLRNTAISLFRLHGHCGIAAAQRFASANLYRLISWLVCQLID